MLRRIIAIAVVVSCAGAAQAAVNVSCTDSVNGLNKKNAKSFSVVCPVNCKMGSVWGTDMYTTDSSICVAAMHAGVISTDGGPVKVTLKPGKPSYVGTARNGVTTSQWNAFDKSFAVSK
jgi:hypothetical protein